MFPQKPFHKFNSRNELLDYLHRYQFLAMTKSTIPNFFYRRKDTFIPCRIIGYEDLYETFSTTVIDFGEGPYFIHCDYLRDMQQEARRKAITKDFSGCKFYNRPKPTIERQKGSCLNVLPAQYVIFDLETTGLNIYNAEIIQIGAIRVRDNEVVDTFQSYVKPDNPIPPMVTAVNGITDLDVCLAPEIESVLSQFIDFIGGDCLAGYNIQKYDMNLLYDAVEFYLYSVLENDYFDYQNAFKKIISPNNIDNYRLTTIADYYGIDTSKAHSALGDCYLCFDCYQEAQTNTGATPMIESNINIINNPFEQLLLDLLNEIMESEELPANSLFLYSNRAKDKSEKTKSICINEPEYPPNPSSRSIIGKNYIVLKFSQQKDLIEIVVRSAQYQAVQYTFDDAEITEKYAPKSNSCVKEVHVIMKKDSPHLLNYLKEHIIYCIKNYHSSASFSCCSQFVACSDALKCLHQNKLYATGCAYRQNLENGRIFYGKNKNIS